MTFAINDIRTAIKGGGAKPALFQVQITNPIDGTADLVTPFFIQAASLPGMSLGTIQIPYFGRYHKYAGDRTFQPWQVTIINDEDFLIRNSLETWSNKINTLEGNIRDLASSRASLYKAQAQIVQFDSTGKKIREYQFNGLWPAEISEIGVDWGATDQYEQFQVVFQYDSFEVISTVTGNPGK